MKYAPYKHQALAIDFCLSHPHGGLFLGMGLGKTVVTLTVFDTYKNDYFTAKTCLVVAPKNVAENVWAQECEKWDHLHDIRCSLIAGTAKQREAAARTPADLYIVSRDNLVWLTELWNGKLPYDMVVLDELSSFKSTSAKRWKCIKKSVQSVRYVYGLTGTPSPNSYLDLWPQVYLLDGGERLGRTLGEYRNRYFTAGAHKGHIVYEWRPRMGAQDAINRKLKDLCLSMSAEDWLDLPPILYNSIPVKLDREARKRYDKLKNDKVIPLLQSKGQFTDLDVRKPDDLIKMTSSIRGDTAATIAGKLLQMANGAVYDDNGEVIPIHEEKLKALEEIVDTNEGESILVFYNYQHDLDRLKKAFPKAVQFSGPTDVEAWNKGKIPMLLCHPASTGHGLNLQRGGHIIVWFGLTWSCEMYAQANKRLHRPGQTDTVVINHIVAKDTIDEKVVLALQRKDSTQQYLLDSLKGYLLDEHR